MVSPSVVFQSVALSEVFSLSIKTLKTSNPIRQVRVRGIDISKARDMLSASHST